MAERFLFDVFLSHNAKDKPRVRRLAERLKNAGLRVWFDEWNVQHGDIIALKVDEGLEQSRVLLLCISPNALASGWVALERSTAVHRDPSNEGRRFIPLLLEECELPDTVRRYRYVDFRDESEAEFQLLLGACRVSEAKVAESYEPVVAVAEKRPRVSRPTWGMGVEPEESVAEARLLLEGHSNIVAGVAITSSGRTLISGSMDKTLRVWDVQNRKCLVILRGHTDGVAGVVATPDGERALSCSHDGTIKLWSLRNGDCLATIGKGVNATAVLRVAVSPDSRRMIASFADVDLGVWDMQSGRVLRTLVGHSGSVHCAAFAIDGKTVVTGAGDHSLKIWDIETGECLATLAGHAGSVMVAAFQPDGNIVSGSFDRTIKVWDSKTGRCLSTFEGHEHYIYDIALTNDGKTVASASFDGTVRVWDLATGVCYRTYRHPGPVHAVAISPDGKTIVSGCYDGIIRFWDSLPFLPPPIDVRRYVNAKIVLLGEGTVGKTSLAHRLIDDKYVIRDRTHGMNVWRLDLPLAPNSVLEREALLWDLAGQEDYRLIHRLFLDETALALLLVNPQKDDPFAEAGDWLKALKSAASRSRAAREAARLLIFSQIDVGGIKLSNAKIERFKEQYGFTGWLPTSAKTGENCSDEANDGKPSQLK